MGKKYTVIEPNVNDYIELMKRKCFTYNIMK